MDITSTNTEELPFFEPPETGHKWLSYGASAINIYKNYLIIGTNQGAILYYRIETVDSKIDVKSGAFTLYYGNDKAITSMSISADSSLAAVGYNDGCIQVKKGNY